MSQYMQKFSKQTSDRLASQDIQEGIAKWRIWFLLAYQDIKLRYRRSVLGPLWLTLSMAITAYSMGYLYGHLFHADLETYFPYLVAGMLSWGLLSSVIIEQTECFAASAPLIKQIKLPYSMYVHRIITRNLIIFFHNSLVMIPVLLFFHEVSKINFYTLLLIPGLLIIYLNSFTYGLILAMVCARYRDLSQIIRSLLQVIFFITPIMWNPSVLPEEDRYLAMLNPFYSFTQLIRAPLTGASLSLSIWVIIGITTLVGLIFCSMMFPKYRARIVYWL